MKQRRADYRARVAVEKIGKYVVDGVLTPYEIIDVALTFLRDEEGRVGIHDKEMILEMIKCRTSVEFKILSEVMEALQ